MANQCYQQNEKLNRFNMTSYFFKSDNCFWKKINYPCTSVSCYFHQTQFRIHSIFSCQINTYYLLTILKNQCPLHIIGTPGQTRLSHICFSHYSGPEMCITKFLTIYYKSPILCIMLVNQTFFLAQNSMGYTEQVFWVIVKHVVVTMVLTFLSLNVKIVMWWWTWAKKSIHLSCLKTKDFYYWIFIYV